ncbi:hypothetical protein ACKKBG_A22230 [Auxenochlorella protothecoides x Auxenochlorella symbiontica]
MALAHQLQLHQIGCLHRPTLACPSRLQASCNASQRNAAALRATPRPSLARTVAKAVTETEAVGAPTSSIDWDNLGFGIQGVAPSMFVATFDTETGEWSEGGVQPYGPLPMYPSAQVLNYGQAIFEGLKAQRSTRDRIVLFRPTSNAERMQAGAARMSMAAPPEDLFVRGVEAAVRSNASYVPPQGKGSLYLRPLLIGSGPILGVGPAPSYTFIVYAASVGAYFKGGQLSPIDLLVETRFHRAAPRGTGGTKCAGNYSPGLGSLAAAKAEGYSDVLYLDAKHDNFLEEVSSCNVFAVYGKTIRTPPLAGTILPGVTRRSVIELARAKGYTVEEAPVSVAEALAADEVFTTGTAVVLCSVGSLTYQGTKQRYGTEGQPGPVALELYEALTGLQQERTEDPFGWVHHVPL